MTINTTTGIPPQILQSYNRKLLLAKSLKFDLERLDEYFKYVIGWMKKKTKSGKVPAKERQCLEMITKWEQLRERIKEKEKELKEKKGYIHEELFYSFPGIFDDSRKLLRRLEYRASKNPRNA